jgi:nicotinamidase-related amidase
MLTTENTALLVIDVQGKLAEIMYEKEKLFAGLERIIKGAKVLGLPLLWTEQVPEKLGVTTPAIAGLMQDVAHPITKTTFSCCAAEPFVTQLETLDRPNILIAGIETHVCVYQTARDLHTQGYQVHLVTDAVSSRTPENRDLGIAQIERIGAMLTSTEMALFELLHVAVGDQFKAISRIVK